MIEKIDIRIERQGRDVVIVFPRKCSDVTLPWDALYQLGDLLGRTAYSMPRMVSDPRNDVRASSQIQMQRFQLEYVVLFFEWTDRFLLPRNTALFVADRMVEMAITIAAEINERSR